MDKSALDSLEVKHCVSLSESQATVADIRFKKKIIEEMNQAEFLAWITTVVSNWIPAEANEPEPVPEL